ncbi:MAG: phosphotransferase [Chloroflexi bacterium]|nr:phosphotransferase [Chloroflexota bacterium]
MPDIPADAAAIDAAWLTRALQSSGMLTDGAVASVQVEPLGGSQGFAGQLRRLRTTYDGKAHGAPPSFIVKLHSPNAITRELIQRIGAASREIRFYRELAVRAGVPTASLHFAAHDGERYVLLLEDLAPARAGDPAAGCSPEQCQAAVANVAGMHAAWWDSPALASLDWIPEFADLTATRHAICREAWPEFVDRYRGQFPGLCNRVGPALLDGLDTVRCALSQASPTLLHGDFRPDNVMFAAGGSGAPAAFVDWQVMLRGPGLMDVAYFLVSATDRDTRRWLEMDTLRAYRQALAHGGVTGYTAEQCLTDYRLAMADVLSRIVVLTTRVLPEGTAGWSVFDVLAERIAGAVVDLDCVGLVAS